MQALPLVAARRAPRHKKGRPAWSLTRALTYGVALFASVQADSLVGKRPASNSAALEIALQSLDPHRPDPCHGPSLAQGGHCPRAGIWLSYCAHSGPDAALATTLTVFGLKRQGSYNVAGATTRMQCPGMSHSVVCGPAPRGARLVRLLIPGLHSAEGDSFER
jgi:hypothetical protein